MSFEGIPAIGQQMDGLSQTFKVTAAEMKKVAEGAIKVVTEGDKAKKKGEEVVDTWAKAVKDLDELNKKLEKQGMHGEIGELGRSFTGVTVLPGTPGAGPGELFSVEQINRLGQRIFDTGPGQKYAKSLEDISGRIEKLMGPDNYIAKLIEIEIPYLRKGARSADEAAALVQSVLIPFMAGFQRELANPTTPPEMRSMLQELIHLAQSGSGYQQSSLENLQRADAERKRQDDIRDLLNTNRHGMTKAQLDELDKKIRDLQHTSSNIEHAVTGGSTTSTIELFSRDLERTIASLGTSASGGH